MHASRTDDSRRIDRTDEPDDPPGKLWRGTHLLGFIGRGRVLAYVAVVVTEGNPRAIVWDESAGSWTAPWSQHSNDIMRAAVMGLAKERDAWAEYARSRSEIAQAEASCGPPGPDYDRARRSLCVLNDLGLKLR